MYARTEPEPLWTVAQLAAAWAVSPNLIYRLIRDGELAATDVGSGRAKTRVRQTVIDDYLDRRTVKRHAPRALRSVPAA